MVKRAVWQHALALGRGMLCIGCLERRLGRTLTASDFIDAPINNLRPPRWKISDRLRDRLAAK